MNSERVLKTDFFFNDAGFLPLCLQREISVSLFLCQILLLFTLALIFNNSIYFVYLYYYLYCLQQKLEAFF